MKIEEVLAKDPSEWTDDEKAFVKSYRETDTESAIKDRLAREKRKTDSQIADLQSKLDEATEAIEAAKGGSELEKAQNKLEKLQAKIDEQSKAIESERAEREKVERAAALKSVSIPWMDSVSQKYRDSVLDEAFDGIDTEDIASESEKIVAGIVESQGDFIRAKVKKGAGSQNTNDKPDKLTADKIRDLSGKELIDSFDEAFAAAGSME